MDRNFKNVIDKFNTSIVAAEIGVREGLHAVRMLENLPITKLYLIDNYEPYQDESNFTTQEHQEVYFSNFLYYTEKYRDRIELIKEDSIRASKQFKYNFFDYVYIDANHSYVNVKNDLHYWWDKIKIGGFLGGHDCCSKFPGVIEAVKEFVATNNLEVEIMEDTNFFIKKNESRRKYLVMTIAYGEAYKSIAKLSHPVIKKYANKIGADFLCVDKPNISETTVHWEKFQIYDLLEKYDRILYLDTDLIIRKDCPNLFDEVPYDKLGMFNEAPFTDRSKELMIDICNKYETKIDVWDGKYYNSGVMVVSKVHKNLFKKPEKEIFSYYEQSYINMIIAQNKVDMHELHYKFNRMTCMDRNTGEDRHASYIVHYAGYPSVDLALFLIKKDLQKWKLNKNNKYRRHIYVSVSGGLGDQIAAEPSVRYMKEQLYPDDDFVIATHHPRLFEHIENVNIAIHGKANLKDDTSYYIVQSLPDPDTIQWSIVSHLLCHTVDYSSMALMKRILPYKDKHIKFNVREIDYNNLYKSIGFKKIEDLIVVHPGSHWNSKTFPKEYWQAIIDELSNKGEQVCIIGKEEKGDPPDYKAGSRGTVDVICPEGSIDLREKLNLGELGALLSKAKMLISNDSAPIHLAGAFDNWIVLLPSCKHPDHVMPIRYGKTDYKNLSIYKKLVLDDVESRPTQVYPTSADVKVDDWSKYLEDPITVVDKVLSTCK